MKNEETSLDGAACSRSFDDLLDSLDAWIDDALKRSKPIGLTLSRARITITDQRDRIGEILSALERSNQEVKRLSEALEAADEALALIEDVGHGAMTDNVTVARRIVQSAISSSNE